MEVEQPARVEARDARALGLDLGADALEGGEHAVPLVGHAGRVGGDQAQARAARERLPQPQPGLHAVRLGGRGGLADQRLAARLGRERDRPARQLGPPAGGDGELEAGKEDADDHRTHVRMLLPRVATVQARPDGRRAAAMAPLPVRLPFGLEGLPGRSPNCRMETSGDKGMVNGQIGRDPFRRSLPLASR